MKLPPFNTLTHSGQALPTIPRAHPNSPKKKISYDFIKFFNGKLFQYPITPVLYCMSKHCQTHLAPPNSSRAFSMVPRAWQKAPRSGKIPTQQNKLLSEIDR
jgi:hypothetical protein